MRQSTVLACVLCLLCAPAPAALADIYQRVGRDGVLHYTNVQPSEPGWIRKYRGARDSGYPAGTHGSFRRRPDPERLRRYDGYMNEAARLYQLPVTFIRAVVLVESNFYPDAVSKDGAMGLMQLMPATAASMGVQDPFDPRQNVLGGSRFLRVLANRFGGDLTLTVAAYNAGETAVGKYRGVPPYAETRRYVKRVLHHYYTFRNLENALASR